MVKDYRNYLRLERRLSPNTVASYCHDVSGLLEYYGKEPSAISTEDIEAYLGKVSADGLSKRSTAHLVSSLRSFFDWCVQEGEVKDNPCDRVDAPKLGKYLPSVLSVQEVEAILESVDLKKASGKRDRAILEVLYGCGLRVSEAALTKALWMWWEKATSSGWSRWESPRPMPSGPTWRTAPSPPPGLWKTSCSLTSLGNP